MDRILFHGFVALMPLSAKLNKFRNDTIKVVVFQLRVSREQHQNNKPTCPTHCVVLVSIVLIVKTPGLVFLLLEQLSIVVSSFLILI